MSSKRRKTKSKRLDQRSYKIKKWKFKPKELKEMLLANNLDWTWLKLRTNNWEEKSICLEKKFPAQNLSAPDLTKKSRKQRKKLRFRIKIIKQSVKSPRKQIIKSLLYKPNIKKRKIDSKVKSSLFRSDLKKKMKSLNSRTKVWNQIQLMPTKDMSSPTQSLFLRWDSKESLKPIKKKESSWNNIWEMLKSLKMLLIKLNKPQVFLTMMKSWLRLSKLRNKITVCTTMFICSIPKQIC